MADFLSTVTETVCRTAGFKGAVLNLYRPAWDDYEAAFVFGEGGEALLGKTEPRSAFRRIVTEGEQPLPGVFWLPEESGLFSELENIYIPRRCRPAKTRRRGGRWTALFVFLSDSHGAPLATLSLDEPASGRRPTR